MRADIRGRQIGLVVVRLSSTRGAQRWRRKTSRAARIREVGPRDGLQAEAPVAVEGRVALDADTVRSFATSDSDRPVASAIQVLI